MNNETEGISIFQKLLYDSTSAIATACESLIKLINFENDDDVLFSFLENYHFVEPEFEKLIITCGEIGSVHPVQSIQLLIDTFPIIKMESKKPTNSAIKYEKLLHDSAWEKKYHRAAIQHTINYLISSVILYISRKMTETDAMTIDSIISTIVKTAVSNTSVSFSFSLNMLCIDNYTKAISYLSQYSQTNTLKLAEKYFQKMENYTEEYPILIMKLFSEASFLLKTERSIETLKKSIWSFYLNGKFVQEASACLLNIFGQAYMGIENFNASDIPLDIFKKSLEFSDLYSLELRSLIISFSINPKFSPNKSTIKTFIDDICKKKMLKEHPEYILNALIRLLYGSHYLPKTLMIESNFKYSFSKSLTQNRYINKDLYEYIFNKVKMRIDCFGSAQCKEYLIHLLLQIAYIDLKYFVRTVVPQLKDIQFREILLKIYFIILSKSEKDTKLILTIKNESKEFCKSILTQICKLSSPSKSQSSVYIAHSLTRELNFVSGPMLNSNSDVYNILFSNIKVSLMNERWKKEKNILIILNRWKEVNQILDINIEYESSLNKENVRKSILPDPSSINYESQKLNIEAIKLIPLIIDNALLHPLCSLIANKNSSIAAYSLRSIQAIIQTQSFYVTDILNEIYNQFINSQLTETVLFSVIQALKCIMESLLFKEIVLDEKNASLVIRMLILGLCSSNYQIRGLSIEASKIIPHSKVFNFFSSIEKEISTKAKELVCKTMAPDTRDFNQLENISMDSVASSKYHFLYVFYLVALGKLLIYNSKDENKNSNILDETRNMILKIIFELDTTTNPLFFVNLSSILFTTWSPNGKNDDIIKLINFFQDQNINNNDLWLMAATCGIPIRYTSKIIDKLSPCSFAPYLFECLKSDKFIQKHLKDPRMLENGVKQYINEIFNTKYISKIADFKTNKTNIGFYNVSLYIFGEAMANLYSKIANNNIEEIKCILPRKGVYKKIKFDVLTSNEIYAFWFNLSSTDDLYFSKSCHKAFASLVKIIEIPDEWFNILNENLEKIIKHSPEISMTLFSSYAGIMAQNYLSKSQLNFSFYSGIANQLCSVKIFLEKVMKESTLRNRSNDIISIFIIKNIGKLLAISSLYLLDKKYRRRKTAFKFIYVSSLSYYLLYYMDLDGFLEFSRMLLGEREKLKTNLSKYFSSSINNIVYFLSKYLPFISEQYCQECFILESLFNENLEKLKKRKRKDIKSEINFKRFHGRIPSRRVSFSSLSSIKQFEKENYIIDSESNDICRNIAGFIVPWTKMMKKPNFNEAPKNRYVFEHCLPSYQMFTLYTFIRYIANLKCLLPISPPITMFLHPVFQATNIQFLIIVTDLYFSNHDQNNDQQTYHSSFSSKLRTSFGLNKTNDVFRDKCIALLTFAYSEKKNLVMQHFISYLNVKFWYYHNIQISKQFQAFDLQHFLEDTKSKAYDDIELDGMVEYSDMITFVLELFISFYKEDPNGVIIYKNILLLFCTLVFHEFPSQCQKIFSIFLGVEQANTSQPEKDLDLIGPYSFDTVLEYLSEVILEQKRNNNSDFTTSNSYSNIDAEHFNKIEYISHYLIEWSLLCGDSYIASLATKIFLALKFNATIEEAEHALNSIYIIGFSLHNAVSNINKNMRVLIKLIDNTATSPDYENAFCYIYYLCLLCQTVIDPPADFSIKLINLSLSLMKLPEPSQPLKKKAIEKLIMIVNTSLNIIYENRNILSSFISPPNFEGITNLLLTAPLSKASIDIVIKLNLYLMKNQLSQILYSNGEYQLTYYSIAPFIFGTDLPITIETPHPNLKIALKKISKTQQIKALKEFHDQLKTNSINYEPLFTLFCTILKIGTFTQINAALMLASLIINDNLIDCLSSEVSNLTREVNKHKEYEVHDAVILFYSSLMGNSNSGKILSYTTKKSRFIFPNLLENDPKTEIIKWKPPSYSDNIDIFSNVKTWPPLFLTDVALFVSDFMKELKDIISQSKVEPFSLWAEALYLGQISAKPENDSLAFDEIRKIVFSTKDDGSLIRNEKLKLIRQNLKKNIGFDTFESTVINNYPNETSSEDNILEKYCYIDPNEFCPTTSFVDNIGKDIYDLPSIEQFRNDM